MAESKSSDLVAISPLVVWKDKEGRFHHTYAGGQIPKDAVDEEHLKLLKDEDHVGSPKQAEKASDDES